jgi:3-oxoacyl-[acyl-carrier-protein] synthase II
MALRRVVVSSLGQVSALGTNVADAWNALCGGRLQTGDSVLKVPSSLDVKSHYLDMQLTKEPQFAWTLAASVEAFEIGKLEPDEKLQNRIGLVTINPCSSIQSLKELSQASSLNTLPRNLALTLFPGILTGALAHTLKVRGPVMSFTGFENAGLNGIGEGFKIIQRGEADIVIVAGCSPTYDDELMKTMKAKLVDDIQFSEAAGVVVLEDYQHAVNRNARLLAEVKGFRNYKLKDFDEKIKKEILRSLLSEAKVEKPSIAVVSSPKIMAEGNFMKRFNQNIRTTSFRQSTGYSFGATSLLETIFGVMCLKQGIVPGLYSHEKGLHNAEHKLTKQKLNSALVLSQAFTGEFSTILLSKLE